MKWLYGCIIVLAVGLLYFRPLLRHPRTEIVNVWTLTTSNTPTNLHRYRNCSLSTCLRSQRCMLDYGRISVYIQPITRVEDENGNVLTPVPSKEFYAIRTMLLPYSVSDHQQACIFFPGIDFLNLHRFPSIDAACAVANMLNERFYNVLMLTVIGHWNHTYRHILASPIIPLHLYRHRLDISLPPYYGDHTAVNIPSSSTQKSLLVMLFNASSSFREDSLEAFAPSEAVTILNECDDQPSLVCDVGGSVVQWENALKESKFVLIHEGMPYFKLALQRALQATVIPVIFVPNYVLPFSDYIDWHLISLRPSSLARVVDVIKGLTATKVESMRDQIRKVYAQFSTLEGIVNMTVRVLESRMLPIKARSYEHWNMMPERPISLPHLEPAAQLLMVLCAASLDAPYAQQYLHRLAPSQLISSVTVIWRDVNNAPSYNGWDSTIPVEIITGIQHVYDLRSIVKQKKNVVVLIVPSGRCGLDAKTLRKAVNIWRTLPDRRFLIPCPGSSVLHATIIHKILLSSALKGDEPIAGFEQINELLDVHPSLHAITREQADASTSSQSLSKRDQPALWTVERTHTPVLRKNAIGISSCWGCVFFTGGEFL
ncbi:hypothetical protein V3C99_013130 [Haemonchus contortus]